MPESYRPLEQYLRIYRGLTSQIGPDFGETVADIISTRIEPTDLLLIGLSDRDDRFPNYYVTFLEAALQGKNYRPSVIRGVPLNGNVLPKEVTRELVSGKPTVAVEVHYSPHSGLYLAELRAKHSPQRFYAAPIPGPQLAGVWELTDTDELVQLRRV